MKLLKNPDMHDLAPLKPVSQFKIPLTSEKLNVSNDQTSEMDLQDERAGFEDKLESLPQKVQ